MEESPIRCQSVLAEMESGLSNLQTKRKWYSPKRNLREGDVVLVKRHSGRNEWRLGLITKLHSSNDGYVRHVHLKVQPNGSSKSKIIHRSIHDLVLIIPSPELETPQLK